jgi:hypothetical protein
VAERRKIRREWCEGAGRRAGAPPDYYANAFTVPRTTTTARLVAKACVARRDRPSPAGRAVVRPRRGASASSAAGARRSAGDYRWAGAWTVGRTGPPPARVRSTAAAISSMSAAVSSKSRRRDPPVHLLRRARADDRRRDARPGDRPGHGDRGHRRAVPLGDWRRASRSAMLRSSCGGRKSGLRRRQSSLGHRRDARGAEAVGEDPRLHRAIADHARVVLGAPRDLRAPPRRDG